jgi:hypothetical protein
MGRRKKRPPLKYYHPRLAKKAFDYALGLRLIDIGYKAVARQCHPDLGGSAEQMARLNVVRERLKMF